MSSHEQETLHRATTVNDETATFLPQNRCCFNLPCFGSSSIRDKIRAAEAERKWWTTPIIAIKKFREWSEIIAGPKWKTFIRRFNRNRTGGNKHASGGATATAGKFGYDPLSYALNFDQGPMMMRNRGGGGDCDDPDEDYGYYPDFTSRYGSLSLTSKMSTTVATKTSNDGGVDCGQ